MDPLDPRYLPYLPQPQLEIVPVEPTKIERDLEGEFWKKNADVPVEEIIKKSTRPSSPSLN